MRNNPLTKEKQMNTAFKIGLGVVITLVSVVIGANVYTWSQVK